MHGVGGRNCSVRSLIVIVLAVLMAAQPALADDRVTELSAQLASSSSDKARLAAIVALVRLEDRAAMKPLVGALKDANAQVRAIAAEGLGRLGHKAALPALKAAADSDEDAQVRARAKDAAIAVAKANALPDPYPAATVAATPPPPQARKYGGRAGFGRQAHAVQGHPELFVTINSTTDDSPGRTDKKARQVHGEILKSTLTAAFTATPTVTTIASEAQRWGLDPRQIDLSVTKLDVVQNGQYVEVEAQLRLAISDSSGRMQSFLSGGAKVQVPKATFNAKYLPNLRKEALENAMRGMFAKLLAHLREKPQA